MIKKNLKQVWFYEFGLKTIYHKNMLMISIDIFLVLYRLKLKLT